MGRPRIFTVNTRVQESKVVSTNSPGVKLTPTAFSMWPLGSDKSKEHVLGAGWLGGAGKSQRR